MKTFLAYCDGVYALFRTFYSQGAVSVWIRRLRTFMAERSGGKTMKDILLIVAVVMAIGLVLDVIFAWTGKKLQKRRAGRDDAR